jgi:hypothetical protein
MKRIAFLVIAVLIVSFAEAQTSTTTKDITKVFEFTNADYNFGKIVYAKPTQYDLFIKNISNDSASVDNVQVGCGCTTPHFDRGKKFGPGETTKITVGFSSNAMGAFTRNITIFLNGGAYTKSATFRGEGFTAPANPAPANGALGNLKTSGSN